MNVMQLFLRKYKKRINKVIKGGKVFSILFSLMITLLAPPFNIYADTISMSNIVGINYTVSNSMVVGTVTYNNITYNRYSTDYDVEIKLDDSYLGWCQLTIEYDYYDRDSSGVVSKNTNITRRIYINGDTAHIDINILNNYGSQPLQILYSNPRVTTITNSNVVPYGDLATLEDILSVLNDIYVNTSVDLYDELQNIVSNTSISNQYLEAISKLRQYNMPAESYGFNISLFNRNYPIREYQNIYSFNYPVFELNNGNVLLLFTVTDNFTIIVYSNKSINISNLTNYFSFESSDNNYTYDYEMINLFQNVGRCFKLTFHRTSNTYPPVIMRSLVTQNIIAIYEGTNTNNFSTDFALLYGLSNRLLDDLHIVASGTSQSNQSSNNLETQKGSFDTTSNSLYTSENAFNSDMNTKLQGINTNFDPSNAFGSKFLQSANWVRTQFDNITSSTPFGTVLSFSMLLGLSLLIIGKVFK